MRLITLAIHTYDHALALRKLLEAEGIEVTLQNLNLDRPEVSSGIRVRIHEHDLPLALRIVENPDIFSNHASESATFGSPRHFLVPIDFSDHSLNAVGVALKMADGKKGINFIHSYIDPRLTGPAALSDKLNFDFGETEESLETIANANSQMKKFIAGLKDKMKRGVIPMNRFTYDILEGVPEDVINKVAKDNPPLLIIMGTRTARQKDNDMIGSVTAQVFDDCRFPVLSIPANFKSEDFTSPSNILFFSNLDQEDILAMDTLYRFFPSANPDVTIVHIPQRNRFTDRLAGRSVLALSDYCAKTFSHFKFRTVPLSPNNISEELKKLQNQQKYDLLVVPHRRKSAFSRFFNPGLPYNILFQADIPMLVIPV